jgi:ATP-dependent Clp protease adaptor protein ClpS
MNPDAIAEADTQVEVEKPSLWDVLLHNDDWTPMDFVVDILESIFQKKEWEARAIMLEVHNKGQAVAGTYGYEIAYTKALETMNSANRAGHPLKASLREAPGT